MGAESTDSGSQDNRRSALIPRADLQSYSQFGSDPLRALVANDRFVRFVLDMDRFDNA